MKDGSYYYTVGMDMRCKEIPTIVMYRGNNVIVSGGIPIRVRNDDVFFATRKACKDHITQAD